MRKYFALVISVFTIISILCQNVFAAGNLSETNLDGLRVTGNSITYGDGKTEELTENPIMLYINGSIKNADIVIVNDHTLVPLRIVSESLGAKVDWDGTASKVTITDGNDKIELVIGDSNPRLNGEVIPIDVAPQIINDYTYVPLRFIAESLKCSVEWFDNNGRPAYNGDPDSVSKQAHYTIGDRQVIVSRYPADVKALNQSEASRILQEQLIIAYENRFGVQFETLTVKPATWEEQDSLRYLISNLTVLYENDRFLVFGVVWEFMVDKYTGTVFICYHGDAATINIFNPLLPGALGFAG